MTTLEPIGGVPQPEIDASAALQIGREIATTPRRMDASAQPATDA